MAGFDPKVASEILNQPEVMLPLVGSVLPGVGYYQPGATRPQVGIRPGQFLGTLGGVYGLQRQRLGQEGAVNKMIQQYGQAPIFQPPTTQREVPAPGAEAAIEAGVSVPGITSQTVTRPAFAEGARQFPRPPGLGQFLASLSPEERRGMLATPGAGLGGGVSGGLSPLLNLQVSMRQEAEQALLPVKREFVLKAIEASMDLGDEAQAADARRGLMLVLPDLGDQGWRMLRYAEDTRAQQVLGDALETYGLPRRYMYHPQVAGLLQTRFQEEEQRNERKRQGRAMLEAWKGYVPDGVLRELEGWVAQGLPLDQNFSSMSLNLQRRALEQEFPFVKFALSREIPLLPPEQSQAYGLAPDPKGWAQYQEALAKYPELQKWLLDLNNNAINRGFQRWQMLDTAEMRKVQLMGQEVQREALREQEFYKRIYDERQGLLSPVNVQGKLIDPTQGVTLSNLKSEFRAQVQGAVQALEAQEERRAHAEARYDLAFNPKGFIERDRDDMEVGLTAILGKTVTPQEKHIEIGRLEERWKRKLRVVEASGSSPIAAQYQAVLNAWLGKAEQAKATLPKTIKETAPGAPVPGPPAVAPSPTPPYLEPGSVADLIRRGLTMPTHQPGTDTMLMP